MSQRVLGAISSSKRSSILRTGRFDENSHLYGQNKEQEEDKDKQGEEEENRSKSDTWLGIYVVTQFWVICLAVFAFLVVAYASATKLSDRLTLETKDQVSQSHTWFKLAICLRPFMTADLLRMMYMTQLGVRFGEHVNSLDISNEEKAFFERAFFFDSKLDPNLYEYYFMHVHPWKYVSPHILWEFQNNTIRRAFEEFRVNGIAAGTAIRQNTFGLTIGDRASFDKYTILPLPNTVNASEGQPLMYGEYMLSPMYMGCLSITVTQEMAEKQMEISVKFRPKLHFFLPGRDNASSFTKGTITQFESADVFVFDKDDPFTEIPTIKKHAKFSVMATSRERLLITNSKYIRQRSSRRDCEMTEIDAEVICRQHCEYRELLNEINCTLPWMERIRQHPQLAARYDSLPKCSDLDGDRFMEASKVEEDYLCNIKIMDKEEVQECLQSCTESCKSSQVSSFGSLLQCYYLILGGRRQLCSFFA